jgi:hypothetical protein
MKVVNNTERAIYVSDKLLVPTVPADIDDTALEHPRVKELFLLKDITEVVEVEEVT